jgi:hypothetical protein
MTGSQLRLLEPFSQLLAESFGAKGMMIRQSEGLAITFHSRPCGMAVLKTAPK